MTDRRKTIWFDGRMLPWDQAQVHVLTHTLHYGLGVFEGIRCYKCHDGRSAIFRLPEHLRRFLNSAKLLTMQIPFSIEELTSACLEVVRDNELQECYVRPIAFLGEGSLGLGANDNRTQTAIAAWPWGAYLGEEGIQRGIRAKVSSFQRPGVNMLLSKAKAVGHYVNSIVAKREALQLGFDEAILLDASGYVTEASGENVFAVIDNIAVTASLGSSILNGITRDALIKILRSESIAVEERPLCRDELYVADEVFLCGTAAEVTPVREVDGRSIGNGSRGPITARLQERFQREVRGTGEFSHQWLTYL